jgi:hypothetical protein
MRVWSLALAALALSAAAACNGELHFDTLPPDAGGGGCVSDVACNPTLHCDVPSGECVECTVDAQCSASEPRCDVALHACVECGVASDCPEGDLCEEKQCVVPCPDGSSCPASAPVCDATRGFCILCRTGADCEKTPATAVCSTNGRCVACTVDLQCPLTAPYCDSDGDGCVLCVPPSKGCLGDDQCDPASHTCVHE